MAATATRLRIVEYGEGSQGVRTELWELEFDADATVELNTTLHRIYGFNPGCIGSGGNAATLSLDETKASGIVHVPATGALTVDSAATNVEAWFVQLTGH